MDAFGLYESTSGRGFKQIFDDLSSCYNRLYHYVSVFFIQVHLIYCYFGSCRLRLSYPLPYRRFLSIFFLATGPITMLKEIYKDPRSISSLWICPCFLPFMHSLITNNVLSSCMMLYRSAYFVIQGTFSNITCDY